MTTLTTTQAQTILSLLGDLTVNHLQKVEGATDAIAALQAVCNDDRQVQLCMVTHSENGGYVDLVKAVRFARNLGLKDAKDLVDGTINPHKRQMGTWPIMSLPQKEVDATIEKLSAHVGPCVSFFTK